MRGDIQVRREHAIGGLVLCLLCAIGCNVPFLTPITAQVTGCQKDDLDITDERIEYLSGSGTWAATCRRGPAVMKYRCEKEHAVATCYDANTGQRIGSAYLSRPTHP